MVPLTIVFCLGRASPGRVPGRARLGVRLAEWAGGKWVAEARQGRAGEWGGWCRCIFN